MVDGFLQTRGHFSQDNVRVLVKGLVLEVKGSHKFSCLCCSLMFSAAVDIVNVHLISSTFFDTILMENLIRTLALTKDKNFHERT